MAQWMVLQQIFSQRSFRDWAMNPCYCRDQHDQTSDSEAGI